MAFSKPDIIENRLLAALPRKDRMHMLAECERVTLEAPQLLYEANQRIKYVYFPLDCFASLIASTQGKDRLEVGMIGNEGMLGSSLVFDMDIPMLDVMIQGTGSALRMKSTTFKRELEHSPALRRKLQNYLYVVMRQMAQTATCMRFHLVEERLARWLLMTQDRAHSAVLHLTQEFLSYMLGVRRVGISKAAISLQQRHLISYSRGEIRILDRAGLIETSCRCYLADNEYYAKVLEKQPVMRKPRLQEQRRVTRLPVTTISHLPRHNVSSSSSP